MVVRVNYLCGGSRECGNRANCNDRRIVYVRLFEKMGW